MAKKLDPIISEFETQEQADSYDKWFREKVETALNEPGATYTHDEAMARMADVIEEVRVRKQVAGGVDDSIPKTGRLDPLISEFETQEQADSYDAWFRAKVQAGIDDPRPRIPHDQAMARLRATIDRVAAQKRLAE